MPKGARGRFALWRCCVPVAALLTLPSCLVVISTGATGLVGGNIVFVAVDDHGALVPSLHVTVADLASDWRLEGMTAHDGSFRCDVRSGVTRVRAAVTAPPGYVVSRTQPWPREIDVSSTSVRVEVRVNAVD
jgi:hypothetical protein